MLTQLLSIAPLSVCPVIIMNLYDEGLKIKRLRGPGKITDFPVLTAGGAALTMFTTGSGTGTSEVV